MRILKDEPLAPYTSFGVGGPAKMLVLTEDSNDLQSAIKQFGPEVQHILGYGTNVLISDGGLDGITVLTRSNTITQEDNLLTVDSGVCWDDLVKFSIQKNLYGLELLSGVPGGVGGAVFINITAYGQSVSDCLETIEGIDEVTGKIMVLDAKGLRWGYKDSVFQANDYKNFVILRASFRLSEKVTKKLAYQSALDVAADLKLKVDDLQSRRKIILETRRQAGSILNNGQEHEKTVGSFFRNPVVDKSLAEHIISFDETGKTAKQIQNMNQDHGGDKLRVSAAHVMLAAGFKRNQHWGKVRLHPKSVLKIENVGGASAQQIYDVVRQITQDVYQKLGIELEPEAQILGEFD